MNRAAKTRERAKRNERREAMKREGAGARDTRLAGWMPVSECARKRAVARAHRWVGDQAERLGVDAAEILEAIREHMWLPDLVEALPVAEAGSLAGRPFDASMAEIKAGPVRPIRLTRRASARDHGKLWHVLAA